MSAVADIVTLDNFEEKMPRWNPNGSNHLYALVDMGSNGIRFSISDLSPPRARLLKCVYRERAGISLFDALNKPKDGQNAAPLTFPAETISLVSRTLARFWSIAVNDYGVPRTQVTVFATEAMRRAENAASMLEAIKSAVPGLVVHILAPPVETLFGSVGARSGFVDAKGLFLDLGGGSVQMTYIDTYAARGGAQDSSGVGYEVAAALTGQSLPFGAARLIRILEDANTEVQASEISKLQVGMREAFQNLQAKFPTLAATVAAAREAEDDKSAKKDSGIDIYLCGGGFRGYGSILMHSSKIQPYPVPTVGSFTVSGKAFGKTKCMVKVNKTFGGKIFGMSKRRREQFPAIITVVEALIAAVPRIRSVTFCAGGNREGALMMKLPREIRDGSPLACLGAAVPPIAGPAVEAQVILNALFTAFPGDLDLNNATTIFGLQLGNIYAAQIWNGMGEDADANASAALHNAVAQDAGCPGLTHLARATLGITLCARWGSNLGPIDQELNQGLRALVEAADPEGPFWADYIGAVTSALATIVTRYPRSQQSIHDNIRFRCTTEKSKKLKFHLEISVRESVANGMHVEDLVDLFKGIGKQSEDKKVVVTTSVFS